MLVPVYVCLGMCIWNVCVCTAAGVSFLDVVHPSVCVCMCGGACWYA